ncbi:hypothetical protein [Methylibium sp.]|uniref:hypothetical protein n=1 Tax=Methylibium sp. TaxID=2067992 RepID=UPI0017FDA074|nr:hypothetical protein [Methylibium sp.]MBA3589689.1 hypothetical protein [Methylibium sp.]
MSAATLIRAARKATARQYLAEPERLTGFDPFDAIEPTQRAIELIRSAPDLTDEQAQGLAGALAYCLERMDKSGRYAALDAALQKLDELHELLGAVHALDATDYAELDADMAADLRGRSA